MSLASLFGGLALANAKLGAVHGFAGPLGGMFPQAPHGAICGKLLPYVMKSNLGAISARDPQNPALSRFDALASLLTENQNATSAEGIDWLLELANHLNVPPLSSYGVREEDFPEIITKAQRASSMKGNPIKLTEDELHQILACAI
jgi:alcohol dehydrogenase class IV